MTLSLEKQVCTSKLDTLKKRENQQIAMVMTKLRNVVNVKR